MIQKGVLQMPCKYNFLHLHFVSSVSGGVAVGVVVTSDGILRLVSVGVAVLLLSFLSVLLIVLRLLVNNLQEIDK